MNTAMSKLALVILSTLPILSSCASTSEIVPYGKDSYIISVDDVSGMASPTKLKIKAAKAASEFCAKQGKVMHVRNTDEKGNWGWTSTSSSLIFSCVDENDAENTRPNLQKAPDVIIENRH
jgi:hypothetical protein